MKLLKKLYRISSPSGNEAKMQEFIMSYVANLGLDAILDEVGNIYVTKGKSDTYPCVVAHMDEVHSGIGEIRIIEVDGSIFGYDIAHHEQCGIGADDKNGIWVALKCLQMYDIIKVAFFIGEEIGCIGSGDADMDFFKDCRFVLQCDRKGSNDFITNASCTELCSAEFVKAIGIEKFGYKEEHGLMTDVMQLKQNGLAVSACNISCGYYLPHSDREYTDVKDLYGCLNLVCYIIEHCTEVYPHEHTYTPSYNDWGWYGKYMQKGKKKKRLLDDAYYRKMEIEEAEWASMEYEDEDKFVTDNADFFIYLAVDELRGLWKRTHEGIL